MQRFYKNWNLLSPWSGIFFKDSIIFYDEMFIFNQF